MDERATNGTQQTLDDVREAMSSLFDALREPYETLGRADPDSVLGAPQPLPTYRSPADLASMAETIEANGRSAWTLHQVREREGQIRGLLKDYGRGLYSTMSVAEWLAMISKFREASLADVMTAMQAPRGWARIDLARQGNHRGDLDKEVLTPRDVAPQLGVDERTVRRRIGEGRLGPWRKRGGRWEISRHAFLRYWDQLASDSDQPKPPGTGEASPGGDAFDHLRL